MFRSDNVKIFSVQMILQILSDRFPRYDGKKKSSSYSFLALHKFVPTYFNACYFMDISNMSEVRIRMNLCFICAILVADKCRKNRFFFKRRRAKLVTSKVDFNEIHAHTANAR